MVRLAVLPDLAPGENTRGAASGAAWSYLLADRARGSIVCLGVPSTATRTVLDGLGEVRVVPFGVEPGPLADGSVGLVALLDARWAERLIERPDLAAWTERVLAPDGSRFVRLGGAGGNDRAVERLPAGFDPGDRLWLGVRDGEIRAAAPAGAPDLIEFALARLVGEREVRSPLRRLARRVLRRESTIEQEPGLLGVSGSSRGVAPPPAYLRASAAAAGAPIDDRRWALVDPGVYATKKVLLFLFEPGERAPGVVVKLVRDPRFNHRLEGAWAGLTALQGLPPDLRGLGPRPVFFGLHAGLAHMAETVVEGDSLKGRLTGAVDDPLVAATADRLVRLELATADATLATPAEVADGIRAMTARFDAIYHLTRAEGEALGEAADRIAATRAPFPLVLQHGDAGTWNVLIDRSGEPVLIDWEASVPNGMPLWDLFYFVRSAVVGVARRAGARDAMAAVEQHLFADTPASRLLAEATRRVVDGTGLDRTLVEPLFRTCWMHRALKESSTLRPGRLDQSHYRRLLGRSIERRDAPGLRRLFDQ